MRILGLPMATWVSSEMDHVKPDSHAVELESNSHRSSLETAMAYGLHLHHHVMLDVSQRAQSAMPRFLTHRSYQIHTVAGGFEGNFLYSTRQ